MAVSDDIRREAQRGVILLVLVHQQMNWMPYRELKLQMARGQGYALTDEELRYHLAYLSSPSRGYVETRRLRPGVSDPEWSEARATARAVDLLEGRLEPDPGVAV